MNGKKFKYIKIREDDPQKTAERKTRKKRKMSKKVSNVLVVVGTTLSSMLLILVIMICIVVVLVVRFVLNQSEEWTGGIGKDALKNEVSRTSFIYAYDSEGKEVEIKQLRAEESSIWADYEKISPNLVNAVIATEDKRFWEHDGVDWRRTAFALGAEVLSLDRAGQGGSTITQQLIKNLKKDDDVTWTRKLREIFRALSLEEKFTKIDIIESYLNIVPLGGTLKGVEIACMTYFGKSASDVTPAEAAIIAGMIRSPGIRNPYADLEACKKYQMYALQNMYEQGYLTLKEYEDAKVEQVKFARVVYGDAFGYIDPRSLAPDEDDEPENPPEEEEPAEEDAYEAYRWNEYEISQNWYVDAAIRQVIEDYAKENDISYTKAKQKIYNGGFKIYLNMDIELQELLEEKFRDPYVAVTKYDVNAQSKDLFQAACVIMDYSGTVVAVAGGLGDKPGDDCFNRATQALRAPGSTVKPISVYSNAVNKGLIGYTTMIPDKSIPFPAEDNPKRVRYNWPSNYQGAGNDGSLMPAWKGLALSRNTIAIRVAQMLTPSVCFNQLTQNLGFTTLVKQDEDFSPITFGAFTQGVKLIELAASYQIFGNRGLYYEPKMYSRVIDGNTNEIVLSQDFFATQAISSESAWITNRMMRNVVTDRSGESSGYRADLGKVEVIGKTGTSNDEKNLLFMGCTPNYVTAIWTGYDDGRKIPSMTECGRRYASEIWKNVMKDVEDLTQDCKFTPDSSCVERKYCRKTGLLASEDCEHSDIGYFVRTALPEFCTGDCDAIAQMILDDWAETDAANAKKIEEGKWAY